MKSPLNLLDEKKIKIEELLLDPNNPRFSKHIEDITPDSQVGDLEVQRVAYQQMNDLKNRFEIDELVEAILADGFIHVDKIFVKKIDNKYLVIEGNRRVTAIKKIFAERGGSVDDELRQQLEEIPCIVVESDNPEANNIIRKILGLRHHGSILPWKPLPAAFNLYQEYMIECCSGDIKKASEPINFIYKPDVAKRVAAMFSVKLSDVRNKVKLYRVYLQLLEASRQSQAVANSDSFSMLEETLGRTALKEYFGYDESLSTLSDEGVEKILDIYFGFSGNNPAITEASAGPSNVRDFAYVVSEGTEEDIRRITIDREKASVVKAEVETKRSTRSLQNSLELILNELNKINLGEIGDHGLAPNEIESLALIQKKLDKFKHFSS